MLPRRGRLRLTWIAGALLLALMSLTGCAEIEVINATPEVSTQNAFTSPVAGTIAHNLAILAVDFDPPLDYHQLLLRRQSVSLVVAVENTGASRERGVTVRAQLSSPEDPDLLLTQGASVASIAPGEIQVVRFAQLGQIPLHSTYRLEVIVEPVGDESEIGDNSKAYDIQIHQEMSP